MDCLDDDRIGSDVDDRGLLEVMDGLIDGLLSCLMYWIDSMMGLDIDYDNRELLGAIVGLIDDGLSHRR